MFTFGCVLGPIVYIIDMMPPRQHCIHNMSPWKIGFYRVIAIVLFVIAVPILETLHILTNPDTEENIFRSISMIIGFYMITLRALPINLNTTAIMEIIKKYENCYNDLEYSNHIQRTLKTMYIVSRGIAFATFLVTICLFSAPVFSDPPFSCLPFPGILNINTSISPNFELVYIYQIITATLRLILFLMSIFVVLGLMYATIGLFHELNEQLKNKTLVECIRFHQKILSLFEEFESFFVLATLVSLGASILILAILVYYATIVDLSLDTFGTLMCIPLIINELFLYNCCGNEIGIQHETLMYTVYTLNWYECLNKKDYMRNIIILMTRLNKPVQFRAGKIYPLSLVTFVAIIKTSYSYFTILRNINQ